MGLLRLPGSYYSFCYRWRQAVHTSDQPQTNLEYYWFVPWYWKKLFRKVALHRDLHLHMQG
ncbi:hypothetical protein HOLleu_32733 [Holothuria leucospilota]|uniref:Uncharacterized protein n=1 Tax=Holothuria leucospilota TaxID=206669 RepID=A0A9Q1BJ65_HOLLE|nr:hypothetical protein HOLleu_32733 [Holothuria leucospilota]